jgi:hypothetical protein
MASQITPLRRRKVFRVAAVVSWLLIQVAGVVLPTFGVPARVNQTLIFLVMLGFPVAVVRAWAYGSTPEAIRADTGSAPAGSPAIANQGLLYATFVLMLLVAGFQVADRLLVAPPGLSVDTAANSAPGGTEVLFPTLGEINVLTSGSGQTRTLIESDNLYNLSRNRSENGSWVSQPDGPMTRITFGDQRLFLPVWSAGGESVYYLRSL